MFNDIFSIKDLRKIERLALSKLGHLKLMKEAGKACFDLIKRIILKNNYKNPNIIILCGPGNNGGDGYYTAYLLKKNKYLVSCIKIGTPSSAEALYCYKKAQKLNITIKDYQNQIPKADIIIDALLGIGLKGNLKEPFIKLIKDANKQVAYKISIDIPSGLDNQGNHKEDEVFKSNDTITFITHKLALFNYKAWDCYQNLELNNLGINSQILNSQKPLARLLCLDYFKKNNNIFPTIYSYYNKGNFGHLAIFSNPINNYLGAIILASEAAIYCGVGKLSVISSSSQLQQALLTRLPEVIFNKLPKNKIINDNLLDQSFVIGPGFGTSQNSKELLTKILKMNKPTVLDADALNIISQDLKLQKLVYKHKNVVLTPHPLEAKRLLNLKVEDINLNIDRIKIINELVKKFNSPTILKGKGTLIHSPNFNYPYLCKAGNLILAKAGSGDILSGIIGALITQKYSLENSLLLGVWLHGRAAELLSNDNHHYGYRISDIFPYLKILLKQIKN